MTPDEMVLDERLQTLWQDLIALHHAQREHTWQTYRRVNPFCEDLFHWKEKGSFFGGHEVTLYDSATVIGDVEIGDHTWVGPFVIIDGNAPVRIGRYCSLTAASHVLTHDSVRWALSGGRQERETAPVEIGDCCFVGTGAVITRGVTIGAHSLVAANAVVTRSVPSHSIVAGVPARRVGEVEVTDYGEVHMHFGDRNGSGKSGD